MCLLPSYDYMVDLVFDEISFNGSVLAISVSQGHTCFNVPYVYEVETILQNNFMTL